MIFLNLLDMREQIKSNIEKYYGIIDKEIQTQFFIEKNFINLYTFYRQT